MVFTAVSENSYHNDQKLYEDEYFCNLFKLKTWKNILKTPVINFNFEIHKEDLGRIERQDSIFLKDKNVYI